jgi:hypothetical protein
MSDADTMGMSDDEVAYLTAAERDEARESRALNSQMNTILFECHPDDAALFSAYSVLRHQAFIVTVLGSDFARYAETEAAAAVLGGQSMNLGFSEANPDWDKVGYRMEHLDGTRMDVDLVFAPLEEEGGHSQHNEVGLLAREIFGDRCRFYATYKRGHSRTRTDNEVTPEPDWYARKFNAMSCYVSQINHPQMRPWFAADDMLREWVA